MAARLPLARIVRFPSTCVTPRDTGVVPREKSLRSRNSSPCMLILATLPSMRPAITKGRKSKSFARVPRPKLCRRMEHGRAGRAGLVQNGSRYLDSSFNERSWTTFDSQKEIAMHVEYFLSGLRGLQDIAEISCPGKSRDLIHRQSPKCRLESDITYFCTFSWPLNPRFRR
jgi:hypothetical protein